jgi:hypothetical protein
MNLEWKPDQLAPEFLAQDLEHKPPEPRTPCHPKGGVVKDCNFEFAIGRVPAAKARCGERCAEG